MLNMSVANCVQNRVLSGISSIIITTTISVETSVYVRIVFLLEDSGNPLHLHEKIRVGVCVLLTMITAMSVENSVINGKVFYLEDFLQPNIIQRRKKIEE